MTQSDAFISISNVTKDYGAVRAIKNVSIDINHAEFFSLLGPSGCGKTTLLRMLAGFETPTSGEIYIDGQAMSEVPPHHRPVNMVFQSYAIFPHLNVAANIAYGLRKQKLTRAKRDDMVDEMLALIELPGYGNRKSNELSGGERQRIALARALIMRPKVLLLDEPLGALDKKLREQMQLELRALQRAVGITFVFVTHDQEEALTLSDRIAVMSAGRDLQVDSPNQLYEAPNSREVAAFIGTMNFFDGRVKSVNGDVTLIDVQGLGQIQSPAHARSFASGEDVLVAVRPEKFSISGDKPSGNSNAIEVKLDNATYLGERSHFYVKAQGVKNTIAVSALNEGRVLRDMSDQQSSVWLSWNSDAVVILNAN